MLTAVLLATKLMYTGIVTLVPSARNNHLVRVVVPNGRIPHIFDVPSHVAYVMFDMRNLDASGRQPDLVYTIPQGKFGVCIINQELLTVSGTFTTTPLCQPTESSFQVAPCIGANPNTMQAFPPVTDETLVPKQDSLQWFLDLGRANPGIQANIENDVLLQQPKSGRVAMRMDLTAGKITVAQQSFDLRFAYRLKEDGTCQALAKAVIVTMEDAKNPSKLTLSSTPFDATTVHPDLKLSSTIGDLAVLIGNEPLPDIEMSINILRGVPLSSHHEDTTHHIQLVKDLLKTGTKLLPPAEIPAGACQSGQSPAVSTVLQAGDGGTCNPNGMPAMDPSGN